MDKQRCQSCGMPLGPGFSGTNVNGSENQEYCKFCYMNGVFTQPDLTLDGMIKLSVENMTTELKMPLEHAQKLANDFIPTLKRWKKII